MKAQVTSGEIIEWSEGDRRMLAMKIPFSSDRKPIRLHVRTNQEAVLLNKGMVAARFLPGIYTLSANTATSYLIETGDGDLAFVKSNFLVLKNWEATYRKHTELKDKMITLSGTYDACIFNPSKFVKSLLSESQFMLDDLRKSIETIIEDIIPIAMKEVGEAAMKEEIHVANYLEECLNLTLYPNGILIKNFSVKFS